MLEVRFLLEWGGDRSIGEANLRKGRSPFHGWRPVPPSPRIQNHYAKSGSWGFLERTPEACTNLSCGRFVLCWKRREGIEVLAKPIFVRAQPFNGRHASCLAGAPCACPVSKSIVPNRGNWGFPGRTPEVYTNLSRGRFVLCWKRREGIEVLAKPIFVRAQPFNGWRALRP